MAYVLIAVLVFILSSLIIYSTTRKKYLGEVRGVIKAQYIRGIFAISLFFTLIVMLIIMTFQD